MFITTNHELGFLHIPKCGGSSVYLAFAGEDKRYRKRTDMPWAPWPIFKAHTKFRTAYPYKSQDKEKPVFPPPKQWFATVRNPYARYHTWFYYQQEWDRKRYEGELPLKGGLTKEMLEWRMRYWDTATPLSVIKSFDTIDKDDYWLYAVVHIRTPQWMWVTGSDAKCFKLENIDKMWAWLADLGTHVEPLHNKKNTAKKGTWEDLDEEVLVLIQQRYKQDFSKLKYDMVIT